MESLAYKTPVIGAKIGGVPELIKDSVTGYLFESGNEEQLCQRIEFLWNHPEEVERLTKECTNIVFDSVESYCDKLISYYQ